MKQRNSNEANTRRPGTGSEDPGQSERELESNLRFYATQPIEEVSRRIEELDHEWDLERALETKAAGLGLAGAFLGLIGSRKWLVLTCGVMGFLFQHAFTGWCPPVPILRRLGFRTRREIDREKFGLKTLRGDFRNVPQASPLEPQRAHKLMQAV